MSRRFQFSLAGIVAVALIVIGFWFLFYLYRAEKVRFLNAVHVGMARDDVKSAVGDPDAKLAAGGHLPTWGNTWAKSVEAETWVYYVVPKSQHRFVLTFEDSRLTKIDYAAN